MTAEDEEETRQQKAEESDEEPDRGVNPAAISAAVASALAPALSPLVSMLSQMQQQQAHLAKTLERKSGSGAALSGAESRPASSSSSSEADSRPDDDDSASAIVPYAQPQTAAQFGVAMPGSFSLPPAAVSNSASSVAFQPPRSAAGADAAEPGQPRGRARCDFGPNCPAVLCRSLCLCDAAVCTHSHSATSRINASQASPLAAAVARSPPLMTL